VSEREDGRLGIHEFVGSGCEARDKLLFGAGGDHARRLGRARRRCAISAGPSHR